ncbi:MAG: hypothetical protein JNK15_21575, partial [Planctomycetes bacterium]|nr:hypothetical protein [Planctomycetota bacterium]
GIETLVAADGTGVAQLLTPQARARLWVAVADARGVHAAQNGDNDGAARWLGEALRRAEAIPAEAASDRGLAATRLEALQRLAIVHEQRGDHAAAAAMLDRAVAAYERQVEAEPELPKWRVALARLLGSRAGNRLARGTADDPLPDFDRAVGMLRSAVAASPQDREYARTLAVALAERGSFRLRSDDTAGGTADLDEGQKLLLDLVTSRPDDRTSSQNLDTLQFQVAMAKAMAGDFGAARTELGQLLARPRPDDDASTQTVIKASLTAADLAMRDGDPAVARQTADDAVQRATRWVEARPDAAERLVLLANARMSRGALLAATVGVDEAIAEWTAALGPAETAAASGSEAGRRAHGTLLLRLCGVQHGRSDRAGARAWFQKAMATGITRTQVAALPGVASLFDSPDFRDLLPAPNHAK